MRSIIYRFLVAIVSFILVTGFSPSGALAQGVRDETSEGRYRSDVTEHPGSPSERNLPSDVTIQLRIETDDTLVGDVIGDGPHNTVSFHSQFIGGLLISRIYDAEGKLIIEYREERSVTGYLHSGTEVIQEALPELRLLGVVYRLGDAPTLDAMKRIASLRESVLLKPLAMGIGLFARRESQQALRRGLQVPFQAVQSVIEIGGERSQRLTHSDSAQEVATRVRHAENCHLLDCEVAESDDYVFSPLGGFVTKTLSPRMIMAHNYQPINSAQMGLRTSSFLHRKTEPCGLLNPRTRFAWQDDMVDGCFGRCGSGCGDWTFTHTPGATPVVIAEEYRCSVPPTSCSPLVSCDTDLIRLTTIAWAGTWTATGKVTTACELHDACVRNSPLGLLDPFCEIVFGPPSFADWVSGAGTPTVWSFGGALYGEATEVVQANSPDCNGASPQYPWYPSPW